MQWRYSRRVAEEQQMSRRAVDEQKSSIREHRADHKSKSRSNVDFLEYLSRAESLSGHLIMAKFISRLAETEQNATMLSQLWWPRAARQPMWGAASVAELEHCARSVESAAGPEEAQPG